MILESIILFDCAILIDICTIVYYYLYQLLIINDVIISNQKKKKLDIYALSAYILSINLPQLFQQHHGILNTIPACSRHAISSLAVVSLTPASLRASLKLSSVIPLF
jgi:hypothetical protein